MTFIIWFPFKRFKRLASLDITATKQSFREQGQPATSPMEWHYIRKHAPERPFWTTQQHWPVCLSPCSTHHRFKRFKGDSRDSKDYNKYIPGKYGTDAGRCKATARLKGSCTINSVGASPATGFSSLSTGRRFVYTLNIPGIYLVYSWYDILFLVPLK